MKTIGLIGGMSHESTVEYYKIINEEINKRKKGLHSAKMLIESYDFDEIEKLQSKENWEELTKILTESAKKLEAAGADYIAIATNTMHICADEVQKQINIPLIHIAEAAGNYIKKKNFDTVLLMGTKYTMTKPFYKDKLKNEFNINVIIPDDIEQKIINNIIYDELCIGIIKESSRLELLKIINNYKLKGAKAVVLGCTELPNIIKEADIEIINTTKIHSLEIADKILT
ncbi:TPA: amino acid racemase [Candidatus Galligastranaerophilus gallistercoris]|nr:amino acid racemase [Candidatus Galligastranaerophilus gallistercoris]